MEIVVEREWEGRTVKEYLYGQLRLSSAMITALKKLARENFAHLAPSKINVVLEYSHPPLSERIAAVEKEMQQ